MLRCSVCIREQHQNRPTENWLFYLLGKKMKKNEKKHKVSKTLSEDEKLLWRVLAVRRPDVFTDRRWKWTILCRIRRHYFLFLLLFFLLFLSFLLFFFSSSFPSCSSFFTSVTSSFSSPPTFAVRLACVSLAVCHADQHTWVSKPLPASGWDTGAA